MGLAYQPDLFAPPPMPALPVEPNAHGVYPDDDAEVITLAREKKGWRGMPLAEIRLLHLPQGWLQSAAVQSTNSGFGYGLSETHSRGFHATRHEALTLAVAQIARWAESNPYGHDEADRRKVLAWLETVA